MQLQMIESSAHGDEYDGVIFSQLVWSEHLFLFLQEDRMLFLSTCWLIGLSLSLSLRIWLILPDLRAQKLKRLDYGERKDLT